MLLYDVFVMPLTHFQLVSLETRSRSKRGQDPRRGAGQKVLRSEEQER